MAPDVELFDDLDRLAADAAGALGRAEQPTLYDRLSWLWMTHDHTPPGPLLAARATIGGARAWLFLARTKSGAAGPYASWYTLAFAPVFARAGASERRLLLQAIARRLRGRLSWIALQPMTAEAAELVSDAFRSGGWRTRLVPVSACWGVRVPEGGFAAYWQARPAKLRETFRRKSRGEVHDFTVHRAFDARVWESYEAVYARSWKPAEGSPAFLRAMAGREGAAGTLRLGLAHLAGRPVAAQLWTVENGHATIHKLAYDQADRARSPGTLLSHAMFRHVIDEDHVQSIDYGTGDEPYKAEWMDDRQPLYRIDLADPRSARGLIAVARWRLRALVRPARLD